MKIELKPETIKRIDKELNGRLTDRVINKGIDAITKPSRPSPKPPSNKVRFVKYAFSKPIRGSTLNSRPVESLDWNLIMREVMEIAARNQRNINNMEKIFGTRSFHDGNKKDYLHIRNADMCIRGKAIPDVLKIIEKGAKELNIRVDIKFEWTDRAPSHRRGKTDEFKVNC